MNKKRIKKILSKTIKEWLRSIDDAGLRRELEKEVIVTGGCIVSLLLNERPKDYDIYFTNKETAKRVANYYVKKFNLLNKGRVNKFGYKTEAFVLDGVDVEAWKKGTKELGNIAPGFENQKPVSHMITTTDKDRIKIIVRSDGVAAERQELLNDNFEDVYDVLGQADNLSASSLDKDLPLYRPVFLSSNAITLSGGIQLVIRFYGKADEIHSNYDFVHCTNYWTAGNNDLVLRPAALESILAKELIYVGSKYPLCSIIRTRKFLKRGWYLNAGQYLKMCFQLSLLDLTKIEVLSDQLVGVDSAYFMILIEALSRRQDSDSAFELNYDYVSSIIDKIF